MHLPVFRGGVHPRTCKGQTEGRPIETGPRPKQVIIPLAQHLGAPAAPTVAVGDEVEVGQVIGSAGGRVSAVVHASVSGRVTAIGDYPHPLGLTQPAVVIESDGLDRWTSTWSPRDVNTATAAEIQAVAAQAGLVGLGGAAFPSHVKLAHPPEKPIDTVVLNGCECEPYLTADYRLMLERPEAVIYGLAAIVKAAGAPRAVIAVEDNKRDAAQVLAAVLRDLRRDDLAYLLGPLDVSVRTLPTKYPQGAEKQLIWAVTRRAVPAGKLPMDVGCLVHNVGTAAALADALRQGKPLVERVVTVTGTPVRQPGNYLVRLGTPVREVLAYAGGVDGKVGRLILGGPMMGLAQATDEVPVIKGTSGILALSEEEVKVGRPRPCIHCGRCLKACPMLLEPLYLLRYAEGECWAEAAAAGAMDCIECGTCSYVCPAKRPLVQQIRFAKASLRQRASGGAR